MFKIIQNRKYSFTFSAILVALSIVAVSIWGLNLGIDFTGGSLIELQFKAERPSTLEINQALSELNFTSLVVQPVGEDGILIRTVSLSEDQHQEVLKKVDNIFTAKDTSEPVETQPSGLQLEGEGLENLDIQFEGEPIISHNNFEELRFDSIGPIIGQELRTKAIYALVIVLIAIILYIAYAFRKVSYPVESWKFGLSAIVALIHDTLIIIGIFAVLGKFLQIQIDSYFVTAILTVLGFSVHDTIVTFDRTRENLKIHEDNTFEEVVNMSVNQTLVRSLNTSLTTAIVLFAVLLFGGETIRYFVLALLLGVVVGTYSSIFLASPLLMVWYRFKKL